MANRRCSSTGGKAAVAERGQRHIELVARQVVFSMNSEPSLVTPSEFNICPRTLTAPLLIRQATTMSPLRSCVTADRF